MKSLELQGCHPPTVIRIFTTFSSKNTIKLLVSRNLLSPTLWFIFFQIDVFVTDCQQPHFVLKMTSTISEISPNFSLNKRRFVRCQDGKHSTYSPLLSWKRQLFSWDMRFLGDWYEAGDLAKPVWQPLWNQLRCKRGDGGLSSERMLGETKSMTTKTSKNIIVIFILIL